MILYYDIILIVYLPVSGMNAGVTTMAGRVGVCGVVYGPWLRPMKKVVTMHELLWSGCAIDRGGYGRKHCEDGKALHDHWKRLSFSWGDCAGRERKASRSDGEDMGGKEHLHPV